MLNLLLKKLEHGGTYSLAGLACEFDVSPAQLEEMVGHLVRMGYLKPVTGCEQGHCPGCSISSSCSTRPISQLWSFEPDIRRLNQKKTPASRSKLDTEP